MGGRGNNDTTLSLIKCKRLFLDVKQLKPSDRPLKIQKELSIMGYKFNTPENENYFLFCLNEEVKSKMNEYSERHSIMLATSHANARYSFIHTVLVSNLMHYSLRSFSAQILPAPADGGGKLTRTQSMLSVMKPSIHNRSNKQKSSIILDSFS